MTPGETLMLISLAVVFYFLWTEPHNPFVLLPIIGYKILYLWNLKRRVYLQE